MTFKVFGADADLLRDRPCPALRTIEAKLLVPDLDDRFDVALIQMPFAVTSWPSLGLGLLKSALTTVGITSRVIYFNASFADLVGEEVYATPSNGAPHNTDLIGEWIFGEALWGPSPSRDDGYYQDVILGGHPSHLKNTSPEKLAAAWDHAQLCRSRVEAFLEDCIKQHDWNTVRIVGFTSVFQQHVASLTLAKRLKAQFPHLHIVFGGSNCEGPMGLATMRSFAFIDAVCVGEGDTAFPAYVSEVLEGRPRTGNNILTRDYFKGAVDGEPDVVPEPEQTVDMNRLPFPDFDDFFAQHDRRGEDDRPPARVIFETSRGCWWGQKNHCTFCGLNGTTMAFRYKSPTRAIKEIQYLLEKYGDKTRNLSAADNIIPYQYFQEFLPKLVELNMDLSLFYETKANLRKDQLVIYRKAGLSEIQPGIENLDTDILKLMKKGVSGIQNIQLLKWCKELGITPLWNLIFGFPGERPAAYDEMARRMAALSHLEPPSGFGRLRFDRFSPYVSNPASFGVVNLQPFPAYDYVYPGVSPSARVDMAYYFTGSFPGDEAIADYTLKLRGAIDQWRQDAGESLLAHIEDASTFVIFDTRQQGAAKAFHLKGAYRNVLAQSDGIISFDQLVLDRAEREHLPRMIDELSRYGLIYVEGDRILRLSVPLDSAYQPAPEALARLRDIMIDESENEANSHIVKLCHKDVISLEI